MSDELLDEVVSINSIYGEDTLALIPQELNTYALTLPAQPNISFRIEFPSDYPNAPPSILGTQSIGSMVAKGEGSALVETIRATLAEVYVPGSPSIFDLMEEAGQKLQHLGLAQESKDAEKQAIEAHGQAHSHLSKDEAGGPDCEQSLDGLGDPPPWVLSDAITEKKSVFVARVAPVESVDQAKSYLAHLLATDKKAAKATHNITAWRVRGESGVQFQDCDDDGETAAGGRLLHLLELMNVWGAMVVVTRWYGGIHLGPDRFRLINQCARDAVVISGLHALDDSKDGNKKKGKK